MTTMRSITLVLIGLFVQTELERLVVQLQRNDSGSGLVCTCRRTKGRRATLEF